jgi:hypothetical protein
MSYHDDSCEAQGPGESCCCVYRTEIEQLRNFAEWILDAYDNDEWPAQKDIVTGAREVLGAVDH